ncbi:MAG: AMP-binding protein, partial [Ilumatobacteraceae bacterium]
MTTTGTTPPAGPFDDVDDDVVVLGDRVVAKALIRERARLLAGGLRAMGIGPRSVVATLLRNDTSWFETTLALDLLGAYNVALNWHWRDAEVAYALEDSGAEVVVGHADLLAERAASTSSVPSIVVPTSDELVEAYGLTVDAAWPDQAGYDAWLAEQTPVTEALAPSPGAMYYTSGTSGRPKGVRREPLTTDEQRRVAGEMWQELYEFRPGMRSVVPAPLYHGAPGSFARASFEIPGRVVVMLRFDAEEMLRIVERHRITHAQVVATMFVRMLNLPDAIKQKYDTSSLDHVITNSAPCPADVKQRMIDWWGPIVWESFGSSEIGAVTMCTPQEWLAKPGTVGRPFAGSVVRILDSDRNDVPVGVVGDIYARHPGLPNFTYHGDPDKRASVEFDGLVTSYDCGYLDEDGYLFLADRRSNMVISGGVNIYPAEVEAAVFELPGVRDCVVFGVPDTQYGESLVAHVDAEAGVDEAAIRTHLRDRLASFKVPRLIVFDDALPR